MADRVPVSLSHSARLRAAAAAYGPTALASRAAALLESGEEEPDFLRYLGGRAYGEGLDTFWLQSWGARALEYYWVDSVSAAVVAGLSHPHWRVRMVCARVCAIQSLGVPERLADLMDDENWRVRDAAAWALGQVGEFEHAAALRAALVDPHPRVRARAGHSLDQMAERLDRDV